MIFPSGSQWKLFASYALTLSPIFLTGIDATATHPHELLSERDAANPGKAACDSLKGTFPPSRIKSSQLDLQYIESRHDYWNTKQSQYAPSCIVYPKTAQDVSAALRAIKASKSRFAIKTAGHNPNTFFSSVDAGVLIDMNEMTVRSYDAKTTLGTFEPGGIFEDIYKYYAQFNRTVVGARLGGVGTGLLLGGGLSYLSSQYGLAVDSLRELEVVLPNGSIVIASPTRNKDLFFACRGGGGNAYGVVTKYTVQTRPSGTFTAGNLIYVLDQKEQVLSAIGNFTLYNTDPKASIIGTYEKLDTPDLGLNLDRFILMFLVYDGEDPGNAFSNFTSLHPLVNTVRQMPYTDVTNNPPTAIVEATRGDNIFRVAVHHISESDRSYDAAYEAWSKWCETHKGSYTLSSIDFQPVPRTLTDASNAQYGGNAMQMPPGPWIWLNFLLSAAPGLPQAKYDALQASFRDMVNSVPSAKGLPLFLNDANYDQEPLKTFSTYNRLKGIKKRYDPDGFFTNYTGGWSFP